MKRCPTCDSPAPERHPAIQFEGEVGICTDEFHLTPTNRNRQEYIEAVLKARADAAPQPPAQYAPPDPNRPAQAVPAAPLTERDVQRIVLDVLEKVVRADAKAGGAVNSKNADDLIAIAAVRKEMNL